MQRITSFVGGLAVLAVLGACVSSGVVVHTAPTAEPIPVAALHLDGDGERGGEAPKPYVIVISIDGLRPDAIRRFGARTIERLIDEGGYSLTAQTITPSITLPSHTSMLTGALPQAHGITWNDNQVTTRGRVSVPTIFGIARKHGQRTAAFASKGKFNHLFAPSQLDHFVVPSGNGSWSAQRTVDHVAAHLEGHRPNLLFVHFREPDRYGHVFGWMGYAYGRAVRAADRAVERLLAVADERYGEGRYTVILTADHGGDGRGHDRETMHDTTIPWIAWGRGVVAGELPDGMHTTDTAATALWLLGIDVPATVAGTPVVGAFDAGVLAIGEGVAATD